MPVDPLKEFSGFEVGLNVAVRMGYSVWTASQNYFSNKAQIKRMSILVEAALVMVRDAECWEAVWYSATKREDRYSLHVIEKALKLLMGDNKAGAYLEQLEAERVKDEGRG